MAGQRDPGDDASGSQRRGRYQPDRPAQRVPPPRRTGRDAVRPPGTRVLIARVLIARVLIARVLIARSVARVGPVAGVRPVAGIGPVAHRPELLSGAGLLRRVPAWRLVHVVH